MDIQAALLWTVLNNIGQLDTTLEQIAGVRRKLQANPKRQKRLKKWIVQCSVAHHLLNHQTTEASCYFRFPLSLFRVCQSPRVVEKGESKGHGLIHFTNCEAQVVVATQACMNKGSFFTALPS